ncbi:MAG: hypothetical protein KF708_20080 [Pirellulales bacterium]|nr:hypothetical protein [Pirellulales bacterium]
MSKSLRTLCVSLAAAGMLHVAAGCCGPCGGNCGGGSCAVPSLPPAGAPAYSTPAAVTAPAGYNAPVTGAAAGEVGPASARTASAQGNSLEYSDDQF